MTRRALLSLTVFALFASACSESPSGAKLPHSPAGITASLTGCTADTAQIRALLTQAFSASPDQNSVLGKWNNIIHQLDDLNAVDSAQSKTFSLVDYILTKNRQTPLTISSSDLSSLINQLFCFVGLDANVTDPTDAWIVHVGDPLTTFVTGDKKSGIQFPSNAVLENTLVTANRADTNALNTLLDKYPFVYDWSLTPSQTLTPGTEATIGVCPDPAALANIPAGDLAALLSRLALGHQHTGASFEVLSRTPIPTEMVLDCGTVPDQPTTASFGRRLLNTLGSLLLPTKAVAASRGATFVGGVGGSTSEFSAFGAVDAELFATGGVGGSTSEFVRIHGALRASLMAEATTDDPVTIDGTVGTQSNGPGLPQITIKTYQGTPYPGIGIDFATSAPATYTPVGNASICGSDTQTGDDGSAKVTCLDFGTTVQYRKAYTKLSAAYTLPPELTGTDADGSPTVTISPAYQNWLVASYGPSNLVFTQPPSGKTVAAGSPYTADQNVPARVEVRSDLGQVVPISTVPVTVTLNKNSFLGGAGSLTANAVAGVATFSKQVPTAALGYQLTGSATLSDVGAVSSTTGSNIFDVVAGAAAQITVVGTADYGTVFPSGNPVSPSPKVLVKDAYGNIKAGATVYWTPGGATGAQANGSTGQTTNVTGADGTTSATWLLAEGDNQLRASLQSASGGAEVFFTATLVTTYNTINSCDPGGAKDDISSYFFVVPGPSKNGGLLHTIGLYLSATGAVGQTDPTIGYPMTLVATRTYTNTASQPVTETYTSSALAFLRGDNGASSSADRLVTFAFNLPPVPDAQMKSGSKQPDVKLYFQLPSGGYGRKINFNAGTCGPGKCNPPPGCNALEYQMPLSNTTVYRKSVAITVKGW